MISNIEKEPFWTIPNILSLYRIVSFPFIFAIALNGYEKLFVILFVINLITDILDGFIARQFNMKTKIGARMDSLADIGSYLLAFLGVFMFKWNEFSPYKYSFFLFLFFYALSELFSFIKFKKHPSLHLYSCKIGGYIQGTFLFTIFVFDFYSWFYYIMIVWGIMSFIEEIIILNILPKMQSDVKGLYWIIKNRTK